MSGLNYAEERAYWYLRLNGFFLLTDYVVHWNLNRSNNIANIRYTTDIDLMGIRFPYVTEDIGGREDDFDAFILNHLQEIDNFSPFKPNINKPIFVIAEVKSGDLDENELARTINDKFSEDIIRIAMHRSGIFQNVDRNDLKAITKYNHYYASEANIVKIAFSNLPNKIYDSFINIDLLHARRVSLKRVLKYIDEKNAGRLFFDSSYFQEYINIISSLKSSNLSQSCIEEIIDKLCNIAD